MYMNKIYKVIWSKVKHCWVVVSEIAGNHGKAGSTGDIAVRALLTALLLTSSTGMGMTVEAAVKGEPAAVQAETKTDDTQKADTEQAAEEELLLKARSVAASSTGEPSKDDNNNLAWGSGAGVTGGTTENPTKDSVAIGTNAAVHADNSVAIGKGASIAQFDGEGNNVAIGNKAGTTGQDAAAIGSNANAAGDHSLALGGGSTAGASSTSIGGHSVANNNSIAIGAFYDPDNTHGTGTTAQQTHADADKSIAIGVHAGATTAQSIAFGYGATVSQTDGVAIGTGAQNNAGSGLSGSVALGANTAVDTDRRTDANNYNGFYIGYDPKTQTGKPQDWKGSSEYNANNPVWKATDGAISVGAASKDGNYTTDFDKEGHERTRQITHVAAGSQLTDAVNVAQLKNLRDYVDTLSPVAGNANWWNLSTNGGKGDGNEAVKIEKDHTVDFTGDKGITVTKENSADGKTTNVKISFDGTVSGGADYALINGTEEIKPAVDGKEAVTGYKVKDDGTVEMSVQNGDDTANAKKVTIGGIATKAQQDKNTENIKNLDDFAVKYDKNTDGTVNKNSVTLGGDTYSHTVNTDGSVTANGGTHITNVAYADGTKGSEAVNVDYLNDKISNTAKKLTNKGLTFAADSGTPYKAALGSSVTIKGEGMEEDSQYSGENIKTVVDDQGNIIVKMDKDLKGNSLTVGEKGADGKNGVDGKIGLNGKDGQSADITVIKGQPGLDGKDGVTRIQYVDENNNKQEVATLNDGLKFKGDINDARGVKLNKQVNIVGGQTDESKLSDGKNIGVVTGTTDKDGNLQLDVKLAKELTGLTSVTIGGAIDSKPGTGAVVINNDGINAGGKVITNAGTSTATSGKDVVNIDYLNNKLNNLPTGSGTDYRLINGTEEITPAADGKEAVTGYKVKDDGTVEMTVQNGDDASKKKSVTIGGIATKAQQEENTTNINNLGEQLKGAVMYNTKEENGKTVVDKSGVKLGGTDYKTTTDAESGKVSHSGGTAVTNVAYADITKAENGSQAVNVDLMKDQIKEAGTTAAKADFYLKNGTTELGKDVSYGEGEAKVTTGYKADDKGNIDMTVTNANGETKHVVLTDIASKAQQDENTTNITNLGEKLEGAVMYNTKEENGKTVVDKSGVTLGGTEYTTKIENGTTTHEGGTKITNVAYAKDSEGSAAVNVDKLKDYVAANGGGSWNLTANGADSREIRKGNTVDFTGANGVKVSKEDTDNGTNVTVGLSSKITVGKDGEKGEQGEIGLVGPAGKDGVNGTTTIKTEFGSGTPGTAGSNGVDGKDGITRIVYEDKDGNKYNVATLDDGMKFKGDDETVIAKKLNDQLDIKGGADSTKLTDGNIGVVSGTDGALHVQLAKDIKGLDSINIGGTADKDGNITGGINISKDGIDAGGKVITNAGTPGANNTTVNNNDVVNVEYLNSQLQKASKTDYALINGTEELKPAADGKEAVTGYKVNDDGTVEMTVQNGDDASTKKPVTIGGIATKEQQDKNTEDIKTLDDFAVKYDKNTDNTVNKNRVTLGGAEYTTKTENGTTTHEGGTMLTNVAYADISKAENGSQAVNVDLLKDQIAEAGKAAANADFYLKNGTTELGKDVSYGEGASKVTTGYKADDKGNIDMTVTNENGEKKHVVLTDIASKKQQDTNTTNITKNTTDITNLGEKLEGAVMYNIKEENGKTVVDKDNITLGGTEYTTKTENGTTTHDGGTKITNVAYAQDSEGSAAVNVDKLKDYVAANGGGSWNLTANGADSREIKKGNTVDFTGANGVKVRKENTADGAKVTVGLDNQITLGEAGKDGADGKDGSITIIHDNKETTITLNGKDGKPGVDGKDGITRIEYADKDGNKQEVATLNDGMKFKGDINDAQGVKLNKQVNIVGGQTDESKLSDGANIGVVTGTVGEDGNLQLDVKLAKELTDLTSVTIGGAIDGKPGTGAVIINNEGINAGGKVITNAGTSTGTNVNDVVNVEYLNQKLQGFSGTDYRLIANPEEGSNGKYTVNSKGELELTVQNGDKTDDRQTVTIGGIAVVYDKNGNLVSTNSTPQNGANTGVITLGKGAFAAGADSMALGDGAGVYENEGIALGNGAHAGKKGISIGYHANGNFDGGREGAIAIGNDTQSLGLYSTVIGTNSTVSGDLNTTYPTLFGGKHVQGAASTILGAQNTVDNGAGKVFAGVANSVAGAANTVTNSNGITIQGTGNTVTNAYQDMNLDGSDLLSIAGGNYSVLADKDSGAVAVIGGANTISNQTDSTIIGYGNTVKGDDGSGKTSSDIFMAGSQNTLTNVSNAVVLGNEVQMANVNDVISLGNRNSVSASKAVALGSHTYVRAEGGVALGEGSEANVGAGVTGYLAPQGNQSTAWKSTAGAVSVGSQDMSRQITNVAAGTKDGDAVNVAQLKAVETMAKNAGTEWNLTTGGDADNKATIGKGNTVDFTGANGVKVSKENTADGAKVTVGLDNQITLGEAGKDGADGKDGSITIIHDNKETTITLNGKDGKPGVDGKDGITRIEYADKDGNKQEVATLNDGLKFKGDDNTVIAKKLNEQLDIKGGATGALTDGNIGVVSDNGALHVKLAKDVQLGTEGSIAIGGTKDDAGQYKDQITINKDGINAGNKQITNVAAGGITENSTNAVNGGEVFAKTGDLQYSHSDGSAPTYVTKEDNLTTSVGKLDEAISKVNTDFGNAKFGLTGDDGTTAVTQKLNNNIQVKGADGITSTVVDKDGSKYLEIGLGDTLTVGSGKDGADGKDGSIMIINKDGTQGTIGINGKDGKDGLDGTSITRMEYADKDGNKQEVATMNDGLRFAGDNYVKGDTSTVAYRKLNDKLDIKGGADKDKLTDGNIGVIASSNGLEVKLAKDVKGLESLTIGGDADGKGAVIINNEGINAGGKVITNAGTSQNTSGTDVVNIDYLNGKLDKNNEELVNKGFGLEAENGSKVTQKLGETISVVGDKNVNTSVVDGKIQIALENRVVLGEEETDQKIVLNGNEGRANIGGVVIGNQNGGNYVTSLDNKTWNGTDYVSGRGATEDQLKALQEALNKQDAGNVKYAVKENGSIDYTSVVLGGGDNYEAYTSEGHRGGTHITNVAYATGSNGGEAVNVDYLKDQIANVKTETANKELHIKEGQYTVGAVKENTITMQLADGNGNLTGKTVELKDVAKASDVGNVSNIDKDLQNKDENGNPTHTTVVDAVNNLNNKVGDLNYSQVAGTEIADGDDTTTAIGKLDNKIDDIGNKVEQAEKNHTTVSNGNGITVVDKGTPDKDGNISKHEYEVSISNDFTLNGTDDKGQTNGNSIHVDANKGQLTVTGKNGDATNNVVIDGQKGTVSGLTNTKWDSTLADKEAAEGGYKGSTNAATESQLQQAMAGAVQYDRKDDGTVDNTHITLNKGGAAVTITNVADGKVEEGSKDAVNGGQLHETNQVVEKNSIDIKNVAGSVSRLSSRVNRVGAGAAALAALHPLDFDPDDKWDFAAGYGNYAGADAVALGMYYRPNEDTMFSIGGSMGGGENMVNAGVSFKLGQGNNVSTSRVAMAKEIKDLRAVVAAQGAQIQQLVSLVGELTGKRTVQENLADPIFPDVPENHWAYEYVKGLAEQGIITGYPAGDFGGDRAMTRYEFAAMLYRALEKGVKIPAGLEAEFHMELERFRVDTVAKDQDGRPTIERVRAVKGK